MRDFLIFFIGHALHAFYENRGRERYSERERMREREHRDISTPTHTIYTHYLATFTIIDIDFFNS